MNQAVFEYQPEPEENVTSDVTGNVTEESDNHEPTGTDLVFVGSLKAVDVFKAGGADRILDDIEEKAKSVVYDVTTEKGRKEIASMAYKIARSKTALDDQGKQLKADHQKIVDEIDVERKKIRDRLDNLKQEVRKPLTEYENREKERVEKHQSRLESLKQQAVFENIDPPLHLIQTKIDLLEEIYDTHEWEEFGDTANAHYINTKDKLNQMFIARKKRDDEAAELERLRREEEERKQREREEQLKREAAEKARLEAEEKARKEAEEAERKAREERERIQREKDEAEAKAKKAEEDRIAAEKRAEEEAKEAKIRAEREKQEAVEAERKRQEDEKRKAEEERQKREADKEHKEKIHADVIKSFIDYTWCDQSIAEEILEAIIAGNIPHVKIVY